MEISQNLLTLFSGTIETQEDSFVIEIPERELELGELNEGEVYRIAITPKEPVSDARTTESADRTRADEKPPVEEGEILDVEIEDMGDQGDGITRVGPGYVVIVSDTKVGDRVTVEISETRENVAFADVIERADRSI